MKITTLPVYSKLAGSIPVEIADKLPEGWSLSQHQVETYKALTGGKAQVIFNTAMTGDGKSLAGQLPTLLKPLDAPLFAMYPTNELVHDQEKQLAQNQIRWNVPELYKACLDSAKLDQMMAGDEFGQRGEALLSEVNNRDVLLTNPDIFHYIMEHFYRRKDDAPDKIIGPLVNKFKQFTFDEFHIFDTPQVISVVNAMLFINEMTGARAPRYLFLSATPGQQMLEFLDRSGLRYVEINPAREGWYLHTTTEPASGGWRRILHGSDISFAPGRVEEWIGAHLDDTVLPFFLNHKSAAKGAIIVNSVAAAMRLLAYLKPKFDAYGLTVAPNTGLTSRTGRAASYEADLLIGTSTVDVGVDFDINFLLFESLNAGTFLQRLGRLGRHSGYTRDEQTFNFDKFEAHALVPEWVLETLFKGRDGAAPLLADGDEITRQTLTETIEEAYPQAAPFAGYVYDWGQFQSLNIISHLNHRTIKTQYSQVRDRLGQRYQQTFNINMGRAYACRRELTETGQKVLVDEALVFRGGSYFDCAILDETETPAGLPKVVDLFMLAGNGILEVLDADQFFRAVDRAGLSRRPFERANGGSGPLAYFRLQGWRKERNDYGLYLQQDAAYWTSNRFGQAIVLTGLELAADIPGLNNLNNHLRRRHLPAALCLAFSHPLELKKGLSLPPLFPVYRFTSRDNCTGCASFGREALLLHTRLKSRRIDCGGGAMIV